MHRGRLFILGEFSSVGGYCYVAPLPVDIPPGDDSANSNRSGLRLFENDHEIGPPHMLHEAIASRGGGGFSHWGSHLFFSSSDGTNPRTNGRTYRCLLGECAESAQERVLASALAVDLENLGEEERYAWGERVFAAFVPDVRLSERARSMFNDAEYLADYERFDRSNYRSFDRKFAMKELAKLSLRIPGDFVECGVFRGASAFLLAKLIDARAPDRRLHLFDSFAGLSRPGIHDGSYWRAGALASDLGEVTRNLAPYAGRIVFHPGWIPQKFHEVEDVSFAFAHIDVDLYEPTRACLDFFASRMTAGGLIVCDDYGFETCPGARRAVDEFAASRRLPVVHLPTGQGVVFIGYP